MLYRIYNLFDSAYRVVSQPAVSAAAPVPIRLASGLLTTRSIAVQCPVSTLPMSLKLAFSNDTG